MPDDAGDRRPAIKVVIFDIGGILEPPFDHVLVPELARMLEIPPERFSERRAADA